MAHIAGGVCHKFPAVAQCATLVDSSVVFFVWSLQAVLTVLLVPRLVAGSVLSFRTRGRRDQYESAQFSGLVPAELYLKKDLLSHATLADVEYKC